MRSWSKSFKNGFSSIFSAYLVSDVSLSVDDCRSPKIPNSNLEFHKNMTYKVQKFIVKFGISSANEYLWIPEM